MNNTKLQKKNILKFKIPIALLSILSLIFIILLSFAQYNFNFRHIFSLRGINWFISFSLFLNIISCFLFILYLFIFYPKKKSTIFVSIIFLLEALSILFNLVSLFYNGNLNTLRLSGSSIFKFFIYALSMSVFISAAISILVGLPKKILPIIAISIDMGIVIISILSSILNLNIFESSNYLNTARSVIGFLGFIMFDIALLLFFITNRLKPVSNITVRINKDTPPEIALRILKDDFDNGYLSIEEYNAKRSEYLNKL